ncbi:MAG TPA: Gfo/Idh/MocA family oxidoreductase [Bryobacteraceae bacterium]|nr:Gfo/Idh/MocA family oxidoreductase [Bryobacteraceae bacterium]
MQPVGYAVVGLGGIAQQAVLPAFANSRNARLVAVVSGDKEKAKRLAGQFHAAQAFSYGEFGKCLKNPEVEAVYIATPPGEHEKYAVQAARAGRHVLCEKPLATTVEACERMVRACRKNKILFMTAYRKYFEPGSVALKKIVAGGDLGRVDIIHTAFTEFRPAGDNSPAWLFKRKLSGGGPLMDLGVYCVNTSRWLVDEDPAEATAFQWSRDRKRFKEVEEGIAFRLDFPSGLVLQGTSSWGSVLTSFVQVHGEKGWACLSPAFAFEDDRRLTGKISGRWIGEEYKAIDEFALELDAFADCIRENREPEPDGEQGMRDIAIIEAIYRSAKKGKTVAIRYPDAGSKGRKS